MDWESAMTGFVLAYYGTERESTMTAQEILDKINSAAAQAGQAASVKAEEERYKQLADDLERTAKASEALDPHTNYGAW